MPDLYHDSPGLLVGQDLADALDFADAVTDLLLAEALSDEDRSGDRGGGAGSYLVQRAVVHQATGMISVQLETGLEEAYARLHAYAFGVPAPWRRWPMTSWPAAWASTSSTTIRAAVPVTGMEPR